MKKFKSYFRSAIVIIIAVLVGYAASLLGVPLPWILGPMLVSAASSLSGAGLKESVLVRRGAQVVVGAAVGLGMSATVLASLLWQLPWMILFAVWSLVIAACSSLLLERWAKLDRRTALLANLPGGVAEMAFLGGVEKGASTAISLIQAMRVTSIVIFLPSLLSFFVDSEGGASSTSAGTGVFDAGTVLVLTASYVLGLGMSRFGIQNAFIVGALLFSVLLSFSGVVSTDIPSWLFICAQIAIGLALGSRFKREDISRLPRIMGIGLLVSLITSFLIILSALLVAEPLGISLPVMTLAGAPGGIAEMMITATSLGLSVAEVVAFQMVRIIVVNMSAGPLSKLWTRMTPSS